jgi:hypothetical protein
MIFIVPKVHVMCVHITDRRAAQQGCGSGCGFNQILTSGESTMVAICSVYLGSNSPVLQQSRQMAEVINCCVERQLTLTRRCLPNALQYEWVFGWQP